MLQLPWTLLPQDSQDPPGYNKIQTAANDSTRNASITHGFDIEANQEAMPLFRCPQATKIGIVIAENVKRYTRNHR